MWAVLTNPDYKDNKWNPEEFYQTGQHTVRGYLNKLEQLTPLKKQRVLDFGCGVGRLTRSLAIHFEEAHGVDISSSMIDYARKNNKNNCIFHINERTDLHLFPDNHFDLVFSVITLQHMPPVYMKKYLQEFIRITRPEGIILFQVPDSPPAWIEQVMTWMPNKLVRWYRRLRYGRNGIMEMYWLKKKEVAQLFESSATLLRVESDDAGKDWGSYTYYFKVISD